MAKQSLAKQQQDMTALATVGEMHFPTQGPIFRMSAYVSFVSLKSPTFPKIAPYFPDLTEGQPVLFEGDKPTKLDPFRFILMNAKAHYSDVDEEGQIVRSTFDPEVAKADKSLTEHIEAVVFVVLPERIVPARCTFKKTKAKAAWNAIEAIRLAATEQWGALSPEHRATLALPHAWVRVTTQVKLSTGVSKSTGFKYTLAAGVPTPTTVAVANLLGQSLKDEAFRASVKDVIDGWNDRIAQIAAKS